MSKYIAKFKQTGNSTINIDSVCKDWNDNFSIFTWINDKEEKYTFVVNGKRNNTRLCKTQISKEQAIEIVGKLNLVHVKSVTLKSAGAYHSKEFVKSEIERITKIKQEKEGELDFICNALLNYKMCL